MHPGDAVLRDLDVAQWCRWERVRGVGVSVAEHLLASDLGRGLEVDVQEGAVLRSRVFVYFDVAVEGF